MAYDTDYGDEGSFVRHVLLVPNDPHKSLKTTLEAVADDADLGEVYNAERHILHVVCTCARPLSHDGCRASIGVHG